MKNQLKKASNVVERVVNVIMLRGEQITEKNLCYILQIVDELLEDFSEEIYEQIVKEVIMELTSHNLIIIKKED